MSVPTMRNRSQSTRWHQFRWLRPLALSLVLLAVLTACTTVTLGPFTSNRQPTTSGKVSGTAASQPAPAAHQIGAQTGGPVAGAPRIAVGAASPSDSLPSLAAGQMVIRSGQVDIEASDVGSAVDRVRELAAGARLGADQGYVTDERLTAGAIKSASIMIVVPSPTFDMVMRELLQIGSRVLNETSSSQDVTEQYVDADAHLQALQATRAQLLTLLTRAQQVSDILAVQRELSTLQVQIDQWEAREHYLRAHSAFSSIAVTIHPPSPSAVPSPSWSPLHPLMSALAALVVIARAGADAVIWLVVFSLPLAAVAAIGVVTWRGISRARRSPPDAGTAAG